MMAENLGILIIDHTTENTQKAPRAEISANV